MGATLTRTELEKCAVVWKRRHQTLRVEAWGPGAIRVRAAQHGPVRDGLPGSLLPAVETPCSVEATDPVIRLRVQDLEVRLEAETGRLTFLRPDEGTVLVEEVAGNAKYPHLYPLARDFLPVGGDLHRIDARFRAWEGERFFGLGQHRHGLFDQKGAVVELFQRNAEVCIPFLLSSRGYGFLWHNPGVGRVELATNGTHWVADAAWQLDYVVFAGPRYHDILARYADAVGHAPMLPDWAAGFWQCKLRYRTQDELLAVARGYRQRGLPLSVIVVDFFHWENQGDWDWDRKAFPDPAAMVRELRGMGVELMVSVWPTVTARSRHFEEMNERGLFIGTERGLETVQAFTDVPVFPGRADLFYYDATNPEARAFVWDRLRANYHALGIRVFWLDACEPEMWFYHFDHLRFAEGPGQAVASLYPFRHQQGIHDGLKAAGEGDVVTLCRSAWAGSQRFGAAVWSGDIPSTWEMFARSIPAGLNIMLSGITWWTTDIGGFAHGNGADPSFRELLVRWFQYGCFCPLFRLHGVRDPYDDATQTGADNEVWSFGPDVYAILRSYLRLRERIKPYVLEQMRMASRQGTPPMRPLFFDFPEDGTCWEVSDAFLLGPSLLVAPVLRQGARTREVWLPAGTPWTDAWTGTVHPGGQWHTAQAPLERIPLFLKNGFALPISPSEPD